jgi:serine/threonine protein phosphatase PrpC
MREMTNDLKKAAGMCPHGNFPESCAICAEEREKRAQEIREAGIETEHSKEGKLFEAAGFSAPSLKHPERNEDAMKIIELENMFIVADGVSNAAAGDVASKMAVDGLMAEYAKTKESITKQAQELARQQKEKRGEGLNPQVKQVIKDSILIFKELLHTDPSTGERKYRPNPSFDKELARRLDEYAEMNIPTEAWLEAIALRDAAITLGEKIKEAGNDPAHPELKGMMSTVTAVKTIEASDGRIFAIALNVGDSECFRKKSDGSIDRISISDSGIEEAAANGLLDKLPGMTEEIKRDPAKLDAWARAHLDQVVFAGRKVKKLKFSDVTQALGKETITPRVTIREIKEGEELYAGSDGVFDQGQARKAMERTDLSLPEKAEAAVDDAEAVVAGPESKGWDDMTFVAAKIHRKERKTTEEEYYNRWMGRIIEQAADLKLSPAQIEKLKTNLRDKVGEIAGRAEELVKSGQAKDATHAMELVGEEILQQVKQRTLKK